ncbi:cupin domain-containing protein [Sulfuriferula nivalis]|uniref:Cupin n=1 Tax=Sulfuriferula nivalis TaxID=2675298 RepID=A0A809RFT5_9PROT|nr:cupin domain-containing protein [Sulfuriferula nivalis]BBP00506.1 cupin [Sulfuriferula nivalis]
MIVNADHSQVVQINLASLPWTASPTGTEQRLLEHNGLEQARTTSIVRYSAGIQFSKHFHESGEEIFVLEGTLTDEYGTYSAGTYIRNPPGSSHNPSSETGCTFFLKSGYMQQNDTQRIVINTSTTSWSPGLIDGLSVMPLSEFQGEHTALVRWQPDTYFQTHRHHGGEEILVLEGTFQDEYGDYPADTWLRSPHMSTHQPFSKSGCTILVKVGHLDISTK